MSHRFFTYEERPELARASRVPAGGVAAVHARVADLRRALAPPLRALRRLPVLARRRGRATRSSRKETRCRCASISPICRIGGGSTSSSTRRAGRRSRRSSRRSRFSSTEGSTAAASARSCSARCAARAAGRLRRSRRPGASDAQEPLPADAERRLRQLDDAGGPALRPVAAGARASRRGDREGVPGIDDHPGLGRGVGGLDRVRFPATAAVPVVRALQPVRNRRGGRSRRLRRSERLDAPQDRVRVARPVTLLELHERVTVSSVAFPEGPAGPLGEVGGAQARPRPHGHPRVAMAPPGTRNEAPASAASHNARQERASL